MQLFVFFPFPFNSFTLGPLDEITLILDDHSMTLQSMSASPFCGPFMPTVQKWEKCLTLVSEIIEEWMATQRKWIYLEGIFIGGDIRDQLPDEAEKFDAIDVSFRRVNWFDSLFCSLSLSNIDDFWFSNFSPCYLSLFASFLLDYEWDSSEAARHRRLHGAGPIRRDT